MKTFYLLIVTIATFGSAHCQTLSQSFNPKAGNKYTSYIYKNKTHSVGSAGANQTYNFTDLATHDILGELNYENAVGHPENYDFPESNIFSKDKSGNYVFFKTSASSNNIIGKTVTFEGSVREISFSDPQTIALPLAYNTLKTDIFKAQTVTSFVSSGLPVKLFRDGKDSIKIDGYGTLNLNGTSKKVNRLSIISNYTDSIKYISDTKRKNIVRIESYYFVGENEDYPTVLVTKERLNSMLEGNSTITVTNTVTVFKPSTLSSSSKINLSNEVTVWMDQNEINIKGLNMFGNSIIANIYDLTGKSILFKNISNEDLQSITLPLGFDKNQEVLIVTLTDGKNLVTKKILK